MVLFNRYFSPGRLTSGENVSEEQLATWCVSQLRTAIIVRLAIMEGAAFFGLVVCVIGATGGALAAEPKYWVNLASTCVLALFAITTFPAKERWTSWFQERFVDA
jgi:hypothetical protein